MNFSISTEFDNQFNGIETLKWLPWVGNDYSTIINGNKLLIVGESYYLPSEDKPWHNDYKDKNFTRNFVKKQLNNPNNDMEKILLNIQKTIFIDEPSIAQKEKFWNSLSHYNFIQRALPSSSNEDRPLESDYILGWENFFSVIDTLKPDLCLFCGKSFVTFNGAMLESMRKMSYHHEKFENEFKVDTLKGVRVLLEKSNKSINTLHIPHPTSYRPPYNPSAWREYIDTHFGNYIKWIRE